MIAVVDYGSGNLRSVAKAFEAIGASVEVTRDPSALDRAERIVLPGVGSFANGVRSLRTAGLIDALHEQVVIRQKPFLGICLGMQMLADEGSEDGVHSGLGWIRGRVLALAPLDPSLKVPHAGWNGLTPVGATSGLFARIPKPVFYFAHSFQFECTEPDAVAATVEYGGSIVAAVCKNHVFGVQFHPEKSQQDGLMLLRNFVNWRPA